MADNNNNNTTTTVLSSEGKPARDPRRLKSRKRTPGAKRTEEGGEEKRERVSKPRAESKSVPIPEEIVGQKSFGKIHDIMKRPGGGYGFILLERENTTDAENPKIYFLLKDYSDETFMARRGYQVEFTVLKTEDGKFHAENVALTAPGKELAKAREEKIAANKATAASAEPKEQKERAPREPRERKERTTEGNGAEGDSRERKPRRPRGTTTEASVTLTIHCEGRSETETIEAKAYESIGKIKYTAVEKFQIPLTHIIYCNRTPENPKGVVLTKSLLRGLQNGDQIFVGPPVEVANA